MSKSLQVVSVNPYKDSKVITIYGISNCDTIKKTLKYLESQGSKYTYHDFRKDGFPTSVVENAILELGAEGIINKRSKTWKDLSDGEKQQALSSECLKIIELAPTLIKRPLIDNDGSFSCGYNESKLR